MLNNFTRNLSKIPLSNHKLDGFWYCTYEFEGDIHELLADELIENNKILSYMKENDQDSLSFLRTNLEDKLRMLKNSSKTPKEGYKKNDGIYMNFLSYEALKVFHGVLPLYLLQRSDIENPKFGIDSVFYKDEHIWVFEFKTSTSTLNENATAKKVYEGVKSLFCKGDIKIASLYDCRTNIRNNDLNPKLLEITNELIDNRGDIEKLMGNPGLVFNVCIVSPSNTFSQKDIIKYIKKEYLDCKNCTECGLNCKQFNCPRFEKIKIFNAFHVQLPMNFSLEHLYDKIIERIKEKENAYEKTK